MLRKLYDKVLVLSSTKQAEPALAGVSFIESSFFPIPPDVMLLPMCLAKREEAFRFALIATIASVLGGLLGYAIGYFGYDLIGKPILDFYGMEEKFTSFSERYNMYGAWIVFIAGLTPFPYKVITIASGVTTLNLPIFIIASIVSRGLRFFVLCALLYWFGPPIKNFIEHYFGLVTIVFTALVIGGFVAIKYVL